jgi:serine/threonine protein kinase
MLFLHSLKTPIIHRGKQILNLIDLKTDNILINENYEPKISDFGLSKYSNSLSLTQIQVGTPIYQSPEQFPQNNKPIVSKPADVYCFGSIIYEVIFEIPPWTLEKVETYDELYKSVVLERKRPYIPIKQNSEFYIFFKSIINSCWNHDQENRPTFEEIFNEFNEYKDKLNFKEENNFEKLEVEESHDEYNKIEVIKKNKTISKNKKKYVNLEFSDNLSTNLIDFD